MALRTFVLLLLVGGMSSAVCAQTEPSASRQTASRTDLAAPWPMERVRLAGGREYLGLVQREADHEIEFAEIVRPAGRPMYMVIRPIARAEIARIERLPDEERARLVQRTQQFRHRIRIELGRMEDVALEAVVEAGGPDFRYAGDWFTLLSTADEETTRRSVVRIEQIFLAYRQLLPPRAHPAAPPTILLFGSLDEYYAYLRQQQLELRNPAVFLVEANVIAAGSELARFAEHLTRIRQWHEGIRGEYAALAADLDRQLAVLSDELKRAGYSDREAATLLTAQKAEWERHLAKMLQRIAAADRRNETVFAEVTAEMFRRFYHEAFHAYLENYVYPRRAHDVPPWLDEGLAQVFEGGRLEADTLRIDAPDPNLLAGLKRLFDEDAAGLLQEMLTADNEDFLVGHQKDGHAAQRLYTLSWGVVYYLLFEFDDPLLGMAGLDRYVAPYAADISPVERFEQLVGAPLAEFAAAWRATMSRLATP